MVRMCELMTQGGAAIAVAIPPESIRELVNRYEVCTKPNTGSEGGFIGRTREYPTLMSHGATEELCVTLVRQITAQVLTHLQATGRSLREPGDFDDGQQDFSHGWKVVRPKTARPEPGLQKSPGACAAPEALTEATAWSGSRPAAHKQLCEPIAEVAEADVDSSIGSTMVASPVRAVGPRTRTPMSERVPMTRPNYALQRTPREATEPVCIRLPRSLKLLLLRDAERSGQNLSDVIRDKLLRSVGSTTSELE